MHTRILLPIFIFIICCNLNGESPQEPATTSSILRTYFGSKSQNTSSAPVKIDEQELAKYKKMLDDELDQKYREFQQQIAKGKPEQETLQELIQLKNLRDVVLSQDQNEKKTVGRVIEFLKTLPTPRKSQSVLLCKDEFLRITDKTIDDHQWLAQVFPDEFGPNSQDRIVIVQTDQHLQACLSAALNKNITPEVLTNQRIQQELSQSPEGQRCIRESKIIIDLWEIRKNNANKESSRK